MITGPNFRVSQDIYRKEILMNIFVLIMLMISLLSCSTMRESIILGAGTGAASGAIGAATLADQKKGHAAVQGALIGGAIGSIFSFFFHRGIKKRDDRVRRETLFNLEKYNVSTPSGYQGSSGPGLTVPKVEAQWIDTQVQGKKLVEGHRIWVITEEPQWVPNPPKAKSK
jgi:hypothetical protein